MRSLTMIGVLAVALSSSGAAQQRPPERAWNLTLGAGALTIPRYPGSDEYRVIPFPLVQASYRDRLYLGPSTTGVGYGLGAYGIRTERLGLAFELGGQFSRPASEADALAGMDDRDGVGTAGVSLGYRFGSFEGLLAVSQGLNDGAGLIETTRLVYYGSIGKAFFTAGAGAALANGKQMRREFGISDTEASRRQALIDAGDDRLDPDDGRAYRPDGGLRHLGAGVTLAYPINGQWALIGIGGLEWLGDEAAASPLVRERVQLAGGAGLGYRF